MLSTTTTTSSSEGGTRRRRREEEGRRDDGGNTNSNKATLTTTASTKAWEDVLEKKRLERHRRRRRKQRRTLTQNDDASETTSLSKGNNNATWKKNAAGKKKKTKEEKNTTTTTTNTNTGMQTTTTAAYKDYTPAIESEAKSAGVSPHLIRGRRYYAPLPPGSKRAIPREVWKICEQLSGRGFKAYVVGGAVRDLLRGAKPRDFDVMTNAKYKDIQKVFGWKRVRVVGRRFKVAHVKTFARPGGESGRQFVEVSSCTEGKEEEEEEEDDDDDDKNDDDGKKQKHEDFDPSWQSPTRIYLRKDAHKRDFTVNGMAYELLKNLLHDYVDGYEDSRDNIVRSIGKPHVAFREDPARILRAIRVSAKRNMEPTKEVRATMRAYAPLLSELNRERRMLETRACLARGYSKIGMKMLWMSSTVDVLMPTVARFIKERGGKKRTMLEFQKTGFEHVLDERSWDEEKKEFRTIFVNDTDDISQEDKYANNSNKKRIPNGVTAGGLFKLLEHFDAYIEKDVKLTEEGVGAEFLIATLAMPIALYYSGLKTVPKYATRKRKVEIPKKKRGAKKTKMVTEVNPAWLRWTAACERVLRELIEVDELMCGSGRRGNNQIGRAYRMMTKSFMDSSYDSNQSDGSGDQDDGADDGFDDEDELSGKKYEESQALVKIVYETFGVPETEWDDG